MILGKGIVAFIMSMLMVCLVGNLFLIENCAAATTFYVGGSGPGNYTTIQEAINNAVNGDTVYVCSGTYNENVYIDKSLNLIGSSKPVINGHDPLKSTIEIMSDQVTILNFEIHNTYGKSSEYSGIAIGKTHYNQGEYTAVTISNCYISDAYRGIIIKGLSNSVNLCEIYSNDYYGIDIISGGTSNIITGNVINDNLRGINLQSDSMDNIIRDNTISESRDYGIHIGARCSNNQIYHNRFIQNHHQVRDIGTNTWDNGYPSGGNSWSDYTGYDNYNGPNQDIQGSDGIGDSLYIIPDGLNKDYYPTGVFQTPEQPGEENQPPNAYIISISPNPAESGQLVSLRGSGSDSNGFIIAYEWRSTIDGKISDQTSFQTTSLSVGVHIISFKVQDNYGVWSVEQTRSITISPALNQIPIAYIDEITPNPASLRQAVLFRGHGTDEDGTITAYKWFSNKDGVISTASSFSKTNLSLGTHTIYFQVKDDTEWSPQVMRTLVVEKNSSSINPDNQAPIADAGGPYQGIVNEALTFNGSGSYDAEGSIVEYWNFGDNVSGTGLSPVHTYTVPGTYTVTLTVTDEDGESSASSTSVVITQSTSQGNNAEGFTVLNLEIPFPIIIIVVFLSVLGVIFGFILRMKRG
jgi:parallel beta-helix repeat protein